MLLTCFSEFFSKYDIRSLNKLLILNLLLRAAFVRKNSFLSLSKFTSIFLTIQSSLPLIPPKEDVGGITSEVEGERYSKEEGGGMRREEQVGGGGWEEGGGFKGGEGGKEEIGG